MTNWSNLRVRKLLLKDLKDLKDPLLATVGEQVLDHAGITVGLGDDGPVQSDRFTDPISPKPLLRLHRLLHLRTSSGGILRNQAERGEIDRS